MAVDVPEEGDPFLKVSYILLSVSPVCPYEALTMVSVAGVCALAYKILYIP